MKRLIAMITILALLTGCSPKEAAPETTEPAAATETAQAESIPETEAMPEDTQTDGVTQIVLSDSGISVDGAGETAEVFTSNDIIYYEDKDTYESGNPYGEGEAHERHSAEEAASHTVVSPAS